MLSLYITKMRTVIPPFLPIKPSGLTLWRASSQQTIRGEKPHCVLTSSFLICASFSITAVLSNKCGFQLQYQMIFCVWLLAFSPQLCEQLRRYNVVPALSDILQESVKEKVTRIILAAFRVCVMKHVCFDPVPFPDSVNATECHQIFFLKLASCLF